MFQFLCVTTQNMDFQKKTQNMEQYKLNSIFKMQTCMQLKLFEV
jgi:hypothetical protein